jgi:flavodoxin
MPVPAFPPSEHRPRHRVRRRRLLVNVLIVYFSQFGNTKQVAEAIGETLRKAGSVRVLNADQLAASDLDGTDVLIAGAPTHVANLPKELRLILEALPDRVLEGVRTAAFDTSYKMNWFVRFFTAAKPLGRRLRKLGGRRIVPPMSFFVVGKEGPLYEGEMERAEAWAEAILARMQTASGRDRARRP